MTISLFIVFQSHILISYINQVISYLRIESLFKFSQLTAYKFCKPAQRSGAGLRIICYPSSDIYTLNNKHSILIITDDFNDVVW